jgi:hypothetical protein
MKAVPRAAYLLAALFAVLIWLGVSWWDGSSDELHAGGLSEWQSAVLAIACAFLPYYLLLKLARRFEDDPDGLLLWWMIVAPPLAISSFVGVTFGIPRLVVGVDVSDLAITWLAGIARHELVLATIYGYTGHLLLKLPDPRRPSAA